MNLCNNHWTQLKDELTAMGLEQFFARDGEELIEHIQRDIKAENTLCDFEPLLGASMTLSKLAMNIAGLAVLQPSPDSTMPCPVCLLQKFDYVHAAAQGALAVAQEKGLVTPVVR